MSRRLSLLTAPFAVLSLLLALLAASVPVPATAQSATPYATVNVTFVACPPGGTWEGPPEGCAEVVEAPAAAMVTFGPEQAAAVTSFQRNADGSYTIPYPQPVAGAANMGFVNFFPENHNAYTFTNVDTLMRWYGAVDLAQGEVRDVTVYFWNGPVDLIMPAENALVVNTWTCDEGIDPNVDVSGCEPMTADIAGLFIGTPPLRGIEMSDYLTREGGTFRYEGLPPYTQAEISVQLGTTGYDNALIFGNAEEITEDSATAFLLRGESRAIDVYLYNPNAQGKDTSWTLTQQTPEPEEGTGTLRLLMLQCPAGVIPHDDPAGCTETLAAGPDAAVMFPETGERLPLSGFERDTTGAYLVTGVQSTVTIEGIAPGQGRRLATDADEINVDTITYTVEPGATRDGRLYYYDAS